MIFGVSIPRNAEVKQLDDKVLIIFDKKDTKVDLWDAVFHLWLTEGETVEDFIQNDLLDDGRIEISSEDKFKKKIY